MVSGKDLQVKVKKDPVLDFINNSKLCDYVSLSNVNANPNANPNVKAKAVKGKDKNETIRIMFNNIRGWKSKSISLSNIASKNKVDIVVLNETHCSGTSLPQLKGYTSYGRNRIQKSKGGIAILVFDAIAKYATKLETSSEPAEFFAIRLDCFSPSIVVMTQYGITEGQYTKNEILAIQAQFFNAFEGYVNEGSNVIVLGDFNNHVGNSLGLSQNNPKISPGGVNLSRWVTENNLSLVNVLDQTHTHIDRSSKQGDTNILDLVITNQPALVKEFSVDKHIDKTPYRLRHTKRGMKHKYTDHLTLMLDLKIDWCKKPITNKTTGWNYSKEGGHEKYEQLTDEIGIDLEIKVQSEESNDQVYDWLLNRVEKAKREAYGKTTSTIKRAKEVADNMMWDKRVKEATKSIRSLGNKKVNLQIWDVRKKASNKHGDKQFVSIKDPETGQLTQDRASTYKTVLEYNYNLLRKDKVEITQEIRRENAIKDTVVRCGMSAKEVVSDSTLSWDEFKEVLVKVKLSNKSVYRDVTKAGWIFKKAYFEMLNKIYVSEDIPTKFQSTELMQLFKNKGSRNELKNNRFIHLKEHGPKLLERMIMMKLERRMSSATPSFQIGGQKLSSTTEHLVTLISYMKHLEKSQGAGVVQFLDIKTCFDAIELRDLLLETTKSGVVGKPLRNIAKFTDTVNIHIQGDESGDTRSVSNAAGQGSGYAPVGTSLSMAVKIEEKIELRKEETKREVITKVNSIPLSPLMYVDDIAKVCKTSLDSADMGQVVSDSLDDLKMSAHSEKSGLLVFGRKREKLKDELRANPTRVQGFTMGFKDTETYLGMQFAEKGASESITQTLMSRRIKCMTKSMELVKLLEDDRIQAIGWLATAINVFNAVIVSTLIYGCGAWTSMTKAQEDLVEAIQRQCLVTVLGITSKCSYRTLLYVTGIMPAMDLVRKTKVTFVNDLFHVKGKGICKEVLTKEYELDKVKGLIKEVKDICVDLDIEDVSTTYVRPKLIKAQAAGISKCRTLTESLCSKSAPYHHLRPGRGQREYFTFTKEKAKLALAYDVGCLNLRGNRRVESMKKYGSIACLVPGCTGKDTLRHVMYDCQGYKVKQKHDGSAEDFVDTLYALNQDRWQRFRTSLINWSS